MKEDFIKENRKQDSLWEKCVDFHGHLCPGLAIGFRATQIAMEMLNLDFSKDEEIVCVTENDACGVDGVQFLSGCTMGKGNLIYRGTGKMAFSFFNRKNGDCIRLYYSFHPKQGSMSREEKIQFILQGPKAQLFQMGKPGYGMPSEARLFHSITCSKCKESVPEHKARIQDGGMVCLDCFEDYNRGW